MQHSLMPFCFSVPVMRGRRVGRYEGSSGTCRSWAARRCSQPACARRQRCHIAHVGLGVDRRGRRDLRQGLGGQSCCVFCSHGSVSPLPRLLGCKRIRMASAAAMQLRSAQPCTQERHAGMCLSPASQTPCAAANAGCLSSTPLRGGQRRTPAHLQLCGWRQRSMRMLHGVARAARAIEVLPRHLDLAARAHHTRYGPRH